MKIVCINGELPKCVLCGGDAIALKSANGRFRIKCNSCGHLKTPFEKKEMAICDWFWLCLKGYTYQNELKRRTESKNC